MKVKMWFDERGIRQCEIVKFLGIAKSSVSKKMNRKDGYCFSTNQIKMLHEHYGIPLELFFED